MFRPGPARWWSVVVQNSWRLEYDPFKFTYNPWQMTTVIIAVVLVASLVVATGVLFNVKPVNSASSSRELYGWSSYPAGGRENNVTVLDQYAVTEGSQEGALKAPSANRNVWTWISSILGLPIASVFAWRATPTNCKLCSCGAPQNTSRIVGGQDAPEGRYTWMVALYYNNKFICGGSLINDRYVLTAAHCVFNTDRSLFSVKFLLYDRSIPAPESFERRVSYIMTNWFVNALVFITNDLALLKLNETVPIGDSLYPVCLPQEGPTFAGMEGIVTGWGKLGNRTFPTKLQEVRVPILSYADCANQSSYHNFQINDRMLCAGVPEGGMDSCQGDSGGPMHIQDADTGKYVIAGVVSYGYGCAQPSYPGIYARVNRFLSWIKFNTRDACYCS